MYKIIGTDGREYGPVSAEQLRQWLAEGRANAQTRVLKEGETAWKSLGELSEFAGTSGGGGGTAPPKTTEVRAAEILARDYRLDVGSCIGRGWELVKKNFWLMVGASFLINLILNSVGIIGGPLLGGLYLLFLKRIRGEPAQLGDAFAGFSMGFLPLFLCFLVKALLGIVGFVCCIIPGIYLIISWRFALPLIIDQKLEFWPAMELSRKVIGKHWWQFFGLALLCIGVWVLGFMACLVGMLVAAPVTTAAWMYAYEDIFGTKHTTAA